MKIFSKIFVLNFQKKNKTLKIVTKESRNLLESLHTLLKLCIYFFIIPEALY